MVKLLLPLVITTVLSAGIAHAHGNNMTGNIEVAMKSELRSDKEKMRDANRMPVETLAFFGIREDMKVLELIPGGGWYTKLLAPALRDKGQYYASIGTSRIEKNLTKGNLLAKAKMLSTSTKMSYDKKSGSYILNDINFNVTDIDAVLTFRNYHNFTKEARMAMNAASFKALKAGGIYGVVDHTRRHMQAADGENGRRFDPVLAIKEIQQAGFELVDYSTLHYRDADKLILEVGKDSVTGKTDRFTLLFKKPM